LFLKDYTQYSTAGYYIDTVSIPRTKFNALVANKPNGVSKEFSFSLWVPPGSGEFAISAFNRFYYIISAQVSSSSGPSSLVILLLLLPMPPCSMMVLLHPQTFSILWNRKQEIINSVLLNIQLNKLSQFFIFWGYIRIFLVMLFLCALSIIFYRRRSPSKFLHWAMLSTLREVLVTYSCKYDGIQVAYN